MSKGKRANLERLLRAAWERQHRTQPPDNNQVTPSMSQKKQKSYLDLPNSIGVVALIFAMITFVLTPPFLVRVIVLVLCFVGFFYFFFKSHWTHSWSKSIQFVCASILMILIATVAAPQLREQWEGKPYCYAIFYRTMGPDGSIAGGKEVLALVEEIKDSPATNVNVTIQDWTGHPTDFDPKALRSDFLPIVYPYFSGKHTACRYTPTRIVYEPSELGTEYWVTISVGNGEDTKERIQFRKSDQCISFMRLKDQKVYIKDHLSPFDHFGGCLMSPSEMAKNPQSGAEWTTACEAN